MSVYDQVTAMFIADLEKQHTEYLASWLSILKGDKTAIFKAASLAQKVSEYIIAESVKFDLESENDQLQRVEAEDHD